MFAAGFAVGAAVGVFGYWLVAEWNEYCDRFSGR